MSQFRNKSIPYSIFANGKSLTFDGCKIMGIINATEDSFYQQSRTAQLQPAQKKIVQMISEGADIIDIGGLSTRPFAQEITAEEELSRILPVLRWCRKEFPQIFISVDTYRAGVAEASIGEGADIINDISAGEIDNRIYKVMARSGLPYIPMHMQGTPLTMQVNPRYEHVSLDVLDYMIRLKAKLNQSGVHQIIWDPGFGFGKTIAHNFELLGHLHAFVAILDAPILVGVSRKGMIWKSIGKTADEALAGTITAQTLALTQGVHILRVHDVAEAKDAITIVNEFKKSQ